MTFSIVGSDPSSQTVGVAIASVFPSVGAVCPYVGKGVGLSTQAWDSGRTYGDPILSMVDDNIGLRPACEAILDSRAGAEGTQLHAVTLDGETFTYTGERATEWAGHQAFGDHTVAGNTLVGPEVLEHMHGAFVESDGPLAEHLLTALSAGEKAGGDMRGDNLSAALLVRGPESSLRHNIRVDNPGNPIAGLWNGYEAAVETESTNPESLADEWGGSYPDSITDFEIKY